MWVVGLQLRLRRRPETTHEMFCVLNINQARKHLSSFIKGVSRLLLQLSTECLLYRN
jgi:hypothetical protein